MAPVLAEDCGAEIGRETVPGSVLLNGVLEDEDADGKEDDGGPQMVCKAAPPDVCPRLPRSHFGKTRTRRGPPPQEYREGSPRRILRGVAGLSGPLRISPRDFASTSKLMKASALFATDFFVVGVFDRGGAGSIVLLDFFAFGVFAPSATLMRWPVRCFRLSSTIRSAFRRDISRADETRSIFGGSFFTTFVAVGSFINIFLGLAG